MTLACYGALEIVGVIIIIIIIIIIITRATSQPKKLVIRPTCKMRI